MAVKANTVDFELFACSSFIVSVLLVSVGTMSDCLPKVIIRRAMNLIILCDLSFFMHFPGGPVSRSRVNKVQ
jgi:hypothetical protein